ncbi:MAG: hypothetical protein ABIA63_14145, partial [bacterium]
MKNKNLPKKEYALLNDPYFLSFPLIRFILDKKGDFLDIEANVTEICAWPRNVLLKKNIAELINLFPGQESISKLLTWKKSENPHRRVLMGLKIYCENRALNAELYLCPKYTGVTHSHKAYRIYGIIRPIMHPYYKKYYTFYRNSEMGTVLLDLRDRIIDYDYNFVEFAGIEMLMPEEILGALLKNFISPSFWDNKWLDYECIVKYLKGVAEKNAYSWQTIYSQKEKKRHELQQEWICSR